MKKKIRRERRVRKLLAAVLALAFAAGLLSCGKKEEKTIILGYDNTAEEAILAGMLVDLIEADTDVSVEVMGDLSGGETVLHPAIISGEIDLYPEYTGTAWLTILKHEEIPDRETLEKQLFQEYEETYDLKWAGLYGFNNSYGLAVAKDVADKYSLETFSDLAAISSELSFGAEPGFFERDDGYKGLCETYGFQFSDISDLTFSLKYDAVAQKKVDVVNIFTTDGRLAISDVAVLTDDRHYFPEYRCGTVIRKDTLEAYPELEAVLEKMDGLVSDADMSALNKQVEVDGEEPEDVAKAFLVEKGLLEE